MRSVLLLLLIACAGLAPRAGAIGTADVSVQRPYPALLFPEALAITTAPGDDTHLYVATRPGRVYVFDRAAGTSTARTFIDISDRVGLQSGEAGLLGLTFDPDYASNGHFYLNYVADDAPLRTVVARFSRSADPLAGDPASGRTVIELRRPHEIHFGGWIGFGPDRQLYIASGDGGPGHDPDNNAQSLDTVLGKVLRIRRDGGIPADNPFVGVAGARPEIWAYGLRNPFRMAFDTVSGRLWAGDVGQQDWEEIDIITRGGNYGWRVFEGNHAHANPDGLPASDFIAPVDEYSHDEGCAVIGGIVYRGSAIPALQGMYVFTDYCTGTLWALSQSGDGSWNRSEIASVSSPAGIGEDQDGELYITALSGRVYRLGAGTGSVSPFAPLLSGTGLFSNTATLTPASDMVEYGIRAPFWSDSAQKRRWFRLPPGGEIDFAPLEAWGFPVGSATVKHFDMTMADGSTRRLETRVFLNDAELGWRGATYRWNTAQTDAVLVTSTQTETLRVRLPNGRQRTQQWDYPSQSACLRCHTEAAGFVLGPKTPQMNRPFGASPLNQIDRWASAGLFSSPVGAAADYRRMSSPTARQATLRARARSYLDSNCSQCHRPGGPSGVDMDLRWTSGTRALRTHNVDPSGGDLGVAGAKRILPGSRDLSLVWRRMRWLDDRRMPPIGSHVVDRAGAELIGDWIDAGAP